MRPCVLYTVIMHTVKQMSVKSELKIGEAENCPQKYIFRYCDRRPQQNVKVGYPNIAIFKGKLKILEIRKCTTMICCGRRPQQI